MTEREAINEILLNVNELPLDDTDNVEDISIAAIADKFLTIARKQVLGYGWYFNTLEMTLYPNTSNYIVIPTSYLSVDGTSDSDPYTVRDYKLFNKSTNSFIFETGVTCYVVDDVAFDDIPYSIANYIIKIASFNAYSNRIGDANGMNIRANLMKEAKVDAIRDNANKIDGNVLTSAESTALLDRTSL